MKATKYRVILLLSLAFALIITVLASAQIASKGSKAPSFKLPTLSGKTLTLEQIRKNPANPKTNRVVLIDFWATWCPPCRASIPHIQKLHEKYGKKGLAVVGISIDKGGAKDVRSFVQSNKMTYTILTDPEGKVARQYGVRGIPTMVILDKKGVIRETYVGYSPGVEKDIDKLISSLLK